MTAERPVHSLGLFSKGDSALATPDSPHPKTRVEAGEIGDFRLFGASAIGQLHRQDGRPRDDAFHIRSSGDWLAAAVSDGAGSRRESRLGASLAAEFLTRHLTRRVRGTPTPGAGASTDWLEALVEGMRRAADPEDVMDVVPTHDQADGTESVSLVLREQDLETVAAPSQRDAVDLEKVMREAFSSTRRDLMLIAEAGSRDPSELHCTLLGILIERETGRFVVGRVGDGLIAGLALDQTPRELAAFAMQGDVGETVFLTQKSWEQAFVRQVGDAREFRSFSLMTDGIAEDIIYPPPPDVLGRALRDIDRQVRLAAPVAEIAEGFLQWLTTYEKPDSRDDRTLVVVWRTDAVDLPKQ